VRSPRRFSRRSSSAPRKAPYTGASADREGYFQAARGGTLFLDEIGDLPLAMQSKLLRAIQERQVRALGSTQEDTVDVRIVSATHRDLATDVQGGRFRQDLFYRLNVIEIVVPPLRERREDLPALCEALLARIAQDSGMTPPKLTADCWRSCSCIRSRQRARTGEPAAPRTRAVRRRPAAGGPRPHPAGAPSAPEPVAAAAAASAPVGTPSDLQAYLDQQEREILVRTLRDTNFNRTAAAQRLGLSLRQIRYRIARLAIATPGSEEVDDPAPG
jgi:two-component system response regulator PilR (NtrC family)